MDLEADIDRLPIDLLANIFVMFSSFTDLAQASGVCKKWKQGVKESLARRHNLSFAGWKMDDDSSARLVCHAYNLTKLDIPRSCWGCQITDAGLLRISFAKCVNNLTSISLWGLTGITDEGVVQLISRTRSLQHLNVGGTFITDDSLYAIARSCPKLETIVLWSCRHVTESGLFVLVDKCLNLKSMNVWGTRVHVDCLKNLASPSDKSLRLDCILFCSCVLKFILPQKLNISKSIPA
ncbi:F-box protein [Mucuna pruriens]|uniref:F-box protein n=1 Tax=Mucuna pruriens TaxID=157652 RepID=A0A371I3S5_MUCPR|nr:F-box protein [Mucuna pruriens]